MTFSLRRLVPAVHDRLRALVWMHQVRRAEWLSHGGGTPGVRAGAALKG